MWMLLLLLLVFPLPAWAQDCAQSQLSAEFATDPTGRTYASCPAGNDACVLEKFNQPCTDAACKIDQVITRDKLYEVIDPAELKTTVADTTRKVLLEMALRVETFHLGIAGVRQKLFDVFPGPSAPITNNAIKALQQKDASRAQIVCGRQATLADVSCGLRGESCP